MRRQRDWPAAILDDGEARYGGRRQSEKNRRILPPPFGCYYERFSNNVFQKKSLLGLQLVIAVNFGFQDLLSESMDGRYSNA